MALVFAKSSGLIDDLWKNKDTALMALMKDTDNEKNKDDELVKALYNVKNSKKFGERVSGITEFSNMDMVDEGDNAPLDDIQQTFPKTIEHKTFMKKFVCTAAAAEDGNIDEMKLASTNFIRAYKRSRADFASKALSSEGAEFTYGSNKVDKTTGDAEGLFSTAHKGKKDGIKAQSNVFTNAFGTDTVMLNRLANIGRNFVNDSGQVMGYTFDTIVIPGNVPVLEDFIKRIIRSDLVVGSNNNDINTQKGIWNLIIDHRWNVATGEPYILLSKEANKELLGNVFYDRIPLTIEHQKNLNTHNLEWSGRARFSAGFYNWRHAIMGGAKVGTTLTK